MAKEKKEQRQEGKQGMGASQHRMGLMKGGSCRWGEGRGRCLDLRANVTVCALS